MNVPPTWPTPPPLGVSVALQFGAFASLLFGAYGVRFDHPRAGVLLLGLAIVLSRLSGIAYEAWRSSGRTSGG